jgi:hypothetical protein
MILIRRRKSWRILILSMWSSSLICGGLVLLLREIWVFPPPWIICLRIWPTGLLSKIVESIQLFHLSKNCHRWTIMCLVHGTSTEEQLSTGNVFAALMGFSTCRAFNLLTMASILWVNSDSPFNSRMPLS